jgi:hypothetical protein
VTSTRRSLPSESIGFISPVTTPATCAQLGRHLASLVERYLNGQANRADMVRARLVGAQLLAIEGASW